MKVINEDKSVECELKFDLIDLGSVEYCDWTYIPYNDTELLEAIEDWCHDIAGNCEWVMHDPKRTKMKLCVNTMSSDLEITLYVMVYPFVWADEEKIYILEHADTKPIFADEPDTERDLYEYIFEMSRLHYEGGIDCGMEDNYGIYGVQLTDEEEEWLYRLLN